MDGAWAERLMDAGERSCDDWSLLFADGSTRPLQYQQEFSLACDRRKSTVNLEKSKSMVIVVGLSPTHSFSKPSQSGSGVQKSGAVGGRETRGRRGNKVWPTSSAGHVAQTGCAGSMDTGHIFMECLCVSKCYICFFLNTCFSATRFCIEYCVIIQKPSRLRNN